MELAPSSSARPSAPRRPMRYRYNPYATSARAVYVSCSGTDCEEAACLTPSECQHQQQQHLEHQQSPYPHVSVLDDGGCCGSETRLAAAEGRQQHQLTEVTTMDSYGHATSCIGYSDEVLLAQHAHDQQQKYVQQQQQQLHSTTVPLFQVPALRRIHARQQQRMQHQQQQQQQQQYQQYQQEQLMASPMPPSPVGYVASAAPPAYVVAPPMATHHHVMQQQQQRQYLSRPSVQASFPRQPVVAPQCSCCCGAAGSPLQYPHHQQQSQQDSTDPLGRIHLDHSAVSFNGASQSLRANVYQRHQRCATGMSAISGASTNGVAPYGMHHNNDVASLPTHFGSHSALDASTHDDCMAAPAASPSPTLTHFAAATAVEYTAVVPMVGRLGGALRRRPSPLEAVLAAAPQESHAAVHPYHHHNSCGRSTVSADASMRSHHSASSVSSSSACAGTTSGSDLDATVVAAPAATVAPVAMTTSTETSAVASGVVSKTAKKRQAAAARAARAAAAAADASNNATASGTSTDESPLSATAASAQEGSEEATKGAAAAAEAPTVPPLVLPDCLTVPWPLAAAPHAFRLSNVPLPEELGLPAEASGEGRYKQLCHGYTSAEYAKYRAAVPRHERQLGNPNHPLTPRADCASTRRAFRDLVFRWRQDLHRWDAMPDAAAAHAEGLPTLLEAGLEPAVRPDSPRPRDLARSAHLALGHSEAELRELGLLEL